LRTFSYHKASSPPFSPPSSPARSAFFFFSPAGFLPFSCDLELHVPFCPFTFFSPCSCSQLQKKCPPGTPGFSNPHLFPLILLLLVPSRFSPPPPLFHLLTSLQRQDLRRSFFVHPEPGTRHVLPLFPTSGYTNKSPSHSPVVLRSPRGRGCTRRPGGGWGGGVSPPVFLFPTFSPLV